MKTKLIKCIELVKPDNIRAENNNSLALLFFFFLLLTGIIEKL